MNKKDGLRERKEELEVGTIQKGKFPIENNQKDASYTTIKDYKYYNISLTFSRP